MFDFLNIFLQPIFLLIISIPLVLIIGIIFGNYLSQPRKPRVLKLSPESGRGVEYEVKELDAQNLYCPAIEHTPPLRFIRMYEAYNILRKGLFRLSQYPLWVGREGTAYIQNLDNPDAKLSLKHVVYNIFGEELYNKIPRHQKEQIENGSVAVTVEFPRGPLTPENPDFDPKETDPKNPKSKKYLPSLSEYDVRRGAIDQFIGGVARGVEQLKKQTEGGFLRTIMYLGTGGCATMFILLFTGHIC